mmetsp:Transcript_27738/g.30827  ORF Transcript_27738/g.30827 Transcript_27738/m.30827 type:complete len:214 (-) Transcript_27738:224-865(-)
MTTKRKLTTPKSEPTTKTNLLSLPSDLHIEMAETDLEVYLKWPLLSKQIAQMTRFDNKLKKHRKWIRQKVNKESSKRQIKLHAHWSHGKLHGELKTFHGSGQLSLQFKYVRGKREGECKSWNKEGQLKFKKYYVNAKKEGDYFEWHDNGQMFRHTYYVDGKREGEQHTWHANGKQHIKVFYKHDVRHGEFKRWSEDGQLIKQCNFVNGTSNNK